MSGDKARWFCGVMSGLAASLVLAAAPAQNTATGEAVRPSAPVKIAVRRLTESQYRHTIADIFGPDIQINARFEPESREAGLLAVGSALLSLTSSGFEQHFALASSIADQVFDAKKRASIVACPSADPRTFDEACARKFIESYGERLFRRPLTDAEVESRLDTASVGAKRSGDFFVGLELALTSLLIAPDFLFRVETAEPDPGSPGQYRVDAYTKASRISFLLWDAAPDEELLEAARSGAIHSEAGLDQQLTRLVSSPRFEDGTRAFFADVLQLDGFENLIKDPAIYPKFNQSVSDAAKEQTLKTVVELLVRQKRDFRDIFTSNETFINRPLAAVYNVPYASADAWAAHTFPASSGRAGILTHVGFLSLFSHPGASSPTRRGVKVLEIFMCEPTPNPPANVDFSKVQDSTAGTVRGRLLDHMENEGCTGCHKRTDPPGLALEHFDGLGQLRTLENGAPIDVSADLKGVVVQGASGLAQYLREDPRVPACLVRNVYSYGVGRKTYGRDEPYLSARTQEFAAKGYRLSDLMVQIASSPEFFKATLPAGTTVPAALSATAQTPSSEGVVR